MRTIHVFPRRKAGVPQRYEGLDYMRTTRKKMIPETGSSSLITNWEVPDGRPKVRSPTIKVSSSERSEYARSKTTTTCRVRPNSETWCAKTQSRSACPPRSHARRKSSVFRPSLRTIKCKTMRSVAHTTLLRNNPMTMKTIENHVVSEACLPRESLKDFQGDFKLPNPKEIKMLAERIKKHGFVAPIFVWG